MVKGKTRYEIETVRVKPWELLERMGEGWVIRSESIKMTPARYVEQDEELKSMRQAQQNGEPPKVTFEKASV